MILGGGRFIGKALVYELCESGHRVFSYHSRSKSHRYEHVIRSSSVPVSQNMAISRNDWDCVIDFTAYNLSDTNDRLQVLNDNVGRYILISSSWISWMELGDGRWDVIKKNDISLKYVSGKIDCEKSLLNNLNDRLVVLRFPPIIGEGDHTFRLGYWLHPRTSQVLSKNKLNAYEIQAIPLGSALAHIIQFMSKISIVNSVEHVKGVSISSRHIEECASDLGITMSSSIESRTTPENPFSYEEMVPKRSKIDLPTEYLPYIQLSRIFSSYGCMI